VTIREAINAKVQIVPGKRVRTPRGWSRHDRVLINGLEIGKIQTRRGRDRIEVFTVFGNIYSIGYDIDWLVGQGGSAYGVNTTAA
jgi:hypothetical protein